MKANCIWMWIDMHEREEQPISSIEIRKISNEIVAQAVQEWTSCEWKS